MKIVCLLKIKHLNLYYNNKLNERQQSGIATKSTIMKKQLFILSISILISGLMFTQANAQSNKELNKLETQAYRAFGNGDYKLALNLFLHLDSAKVDKGNYFDYMIGMCYLSTPESHKALTYLKNAKKEGQTSFVIDYYIGRALFLDKNYIEAEKYLKFYLSELSTLNYTFVAKEVKTTENSIHLEKSKNDVLCLVTICEEHNKTQLQTVVLR